MRSPRVLVIAVLALGVAAGVAWYRSQRRPVEPGAASETTPVEPVRPAVATPPPAAPTAATPPSAGAHIPTEAALMEKIRRSVKAEPAQALDLLAAADAAFPNGPFAEERVALRIDALVYTGEVGRARDHAEEYLRRYPDGAFAAHVEQLTGVHPRPPAP